MGAKIFSDMVTVLCMQREIVIFLPFIIQYYENYTVLLMFLFCSDMLLGNEDANVRGR